MTQVLLVDDYPAVRRFLRDLLDGKKHEFVEAANGLEALETFARCRPDWTIMDIEMPEMDGLKATRLIVELDPQAKVIVISQHNGRAFERAAQEAGALTFIHKDNLLKISDLITSQPKES